MNDLLTILYTLSTFKTTVSMSSCLDSQLPYLGFLLASCLGNLTYFSSPIFILLFFTSGYFFFSKTSNTICSTNHLRCYLSFLTIATSLPASIFFNVVVFKSYTITALTHICISFLSFLLTNIPHDTFNQPACTDSFNYFPFLYSVLLFFGLGC